MPSEAQPEPQRVVDDTGVEFVLGQKIANGAQGTVFRVEGHPDYAIKLLNRPEDLERIAAVRRLPLDGLSVAAPLTLIHTGGTGYLMPLASDMKPIREPYLPQEFGPRETTLDLVSPDRRPAAPSGHRGQHGARIASLHERGLAYVDLNPGNVMVSDDLSRAETWLIDTDNLTSRSTPDWNILGFPRYVAPERRSAGGPALDAGRRLHPRHPRVPSPGAASIPLRASRRTSMDGNEAWEQIDRGESPLRYGPAGSVEPAAAEELLRQRSSRW